MSTSFQKIDTRPMPVMTARFLGSISLLGVLTVATAALPAADELNI